MPCKKYMFSCNYLNHQNNRILLMHTKVCYKCVSFLRPICYPLLYPPMISMPSTTPCHVPTGKASESENKSRVTAIHKLKEALKQETEKLKHLKHALVEVQEKQNMEKQVGCNYHHFPINFFRSYIVKNIISSMC